MALSRLTITFLRLIAMAPWIGTRKRSWVASRGQTHGHCHREEERALPIVLGKPLIRKTRGTMTAMSWIISQVKRLRPRSKLVGGASSVIEPAMVPR